MDVGAAVAERYELPGFLDGRVSRDQYVRWLRHKTDAHVKRDRKRVFTPIKPESYRRQIHAAVITSGGTDWYTGEPLEWEKISTYDNEASKRDRSVYKAALALLPTVDHVLREDGGYDFVICSWRANDAKNDMSLPEFVRLCRKVLARHGYVEEGAADAVELAFVSASDAQGI